jgi:ABC-2 type transport system ATP-binding protein
MIHIRQLTKTYGGARALDDVTFSAVPGRITGFLGLNGSGKTTTLRILLGLTRATSGVALINGQPYRSLPSASRQVGAVLSEQIGQKSLLAYVGLGVAAAGTTRAASFGIRLRLALATALSGEPAVLVLDEPASGLDPTGKAWLHGLLRQHADNGGTVLISSHVPSEFDQLVDDVVIIADGRVRLAAPLAEVAGGGVPRLRVRGRDPHRLWQAFERVGASVSTDGRVLHVSGLSAEDAGDIALHVRVPVYELIPEVPDLEEVFLSLTRPSNDQQ